jgi:hypothetical protein
MDWHGPGAGACPWEWSCQPLFIRDVCVANSTGLLPLEFLSCMVMRRWGREKENRNQPC